MKSTFLSKENNVVKFDVTFTAEEFENAQIDAYKANKGRFNIDGFRKGKAPRKIIESHYGEDVFFEDAINNLMVEAYPGALEELNIEPIDRPKAEFDELKKGEGFTVHFSADVAPEIEVKDYKGVKITNIEHPVSEEDVDKELEQLRERNSRMVTVDRPAELDDTVLIDYAGFLGDEQFEGGTAEQQPLKLGSNSFIPGFEDQLVGAKPGDEVDVNVTFPEEYHSENLAGKAVVFHCKVHEVKMDEKPELNDEFAQDVSEFETLAELRESTKKNLEEQAFSRSEYEKKNAVLEKIYMANDVDIPDVMVETQLDEMIDEFAQQLRYQGMDLNKYFEYLNKDPQEFRDSIREDAFKKVKTKLLVKAIGEQEKIDVSEEEFEKEIADMAAQYQMEPEKMKEALGENNFSMIKADIRNRKTVDFLYDNAVVE